MTDRTFNVPEMSCGHCKAAVEGELSKLAGVERSNAEFEKGGVEADEKIEELTAAVERFLRV